MKDFAYHPITRMVEATATVQPCPHRRGQFVKQPPDNWLSVHCNLHGRLVHPSECRMCLLCNPLMGKGT